MSLEKEFVPYQEALELKELGFDEPCFAVHYAHKWYLYTKSRGIKNSNKISQQWICTAPTFSQAFRFFRDKYNLYHEIKVEDNVMLGEEKYYWSIFGGYKLSSGNSWIRCIADSNGVMSTTYPEAELACLRKLIEIVKTKN